MDPEDEFTVGPDDDDDEGTEGFLAPPPDDPDTTPPAAPPLPGPPAANPVDLQSQIERLQAAVKRNNSENAKHRAVAKWMREHSIDDLDKWLADQGIDPATARRVAALDPTPPAVPPVPDPVAPTPEPDKAGLERQIRLEYEQELATTKAEAEVKAKANEALTTALKDAAIKATLKAARFTGTVERAIRIMDLSKVTVKDDGTVDGIEDEVKKLRDEIPEWFAARRQQPGTPPGRPANDAGDRRPAPPRPMSWEQRVAGRLGGRGQ